MFDQRPNGSKILQCEIIDRLINTWASNKRRLLPVCINNHKMFIKGKHGVGEVHAQL